MNPHLILLDGMERTPKKDLYSVASTTVTRLIKELKYYSGTPNDDQLLAMAVNPFVASWGFSELETRSSLLELVDAEGNHEDLKLQHRDLAKEKLREVIKDICSEIIGGSGDGAQDGTSSEEDIDPTDQMAVLRRQKVLANRARHGNPSTATVSGDPVRATVDQFFDQQFDIRNALVAQE